MIFLFQIILINLKIVRCEWIPLGVYLTAVKNYSGADTDEFITIDRKLPQYINCNREGSYIVINTTQSEVQQKNQFNLNSQMFFVTFDLIFFQHWTDQDYVNYSLGQTTQSFNYNSNQVPQQQSQFCENQLAQYQAFNMTVNTTYVNGYHKFSASTSTGSVAIKNLIILGLRCSPNCKTCYGESFNQCSSCSNGDSNINDCKIQCTPEKPYFVNNQGCFKQCQIEQSLHFKGSCVTYPITYFVNLNIISYKTTSQYRWQQIYDQENLQFETLNNIAFENYYIYGIFKYNQGYQSVINLTNNQGLYLIGIKIELILFNRMPTMSSISLLINETYQAHIYNDGSELKFYQFNLQYENKRSYTSYSNIEYNDNYYYTLYMYSNVSSNFIIKLLGNYPKSSNAGWGIRTIQITSGQCPQYCLQCKSQFQCSVCQQNYLISKSGTCSTCNGIYQQKINNTHCQDLDDQTPYSEYLVKEFIDFSINPVTYQLYTLLYQNGTNFLKGEGIFYSIWKQKYRIFGGPFIWAQAKFQRKYEITRPHYSISIIFIIIFGPTFPENGQFIFCLDNQVQFEITSIDQEIVVDYLFLHNNDALIVEWECKGPDNEPIEAYCGFYQYYLTVHYCKPGCNGQCTNQNDCSESVATQTCQDDQYLDIYKNECRQCQPNCQKCTTLQNCQECRDGYTDPSLGCICGINKFEDYNGCQDCSQDCNQCINLQFCLECKTGTFKVLMNNQCVCQEGYFNDSSICSICKENCKKCTSLSDCSECFEGYQKSSSEECQLDSQFYYSSDLQKLFSCATFNHICNPCQSNVDNCTCGDLIIYGNEDCDDGNEIMYDGCYNCQFQCQQQCTKCINGKCFECAILGWYLDTITQTCKEQCYDKFKVGNEQCDDAINSSNCKDCKYFCKPDCQQCNFNNDNYCYNVCGDSIIVSAPDVKVIEECDDGNKVEFDGCNNKCQFQCQINTICAICQDRQCQYCQYGYFLNKMMNKCDCGLSCLTCDYSEGLGCIECQYGYELRNQICYPICGDSYITFHEECDDGNMNIEDGCHQCLYTCEQTCQFCLFGVCQECYEDYQLENERCILIINSYLDNSDRGSKFQNSMPQLFYQEYQDYYVIEQFNDFIQKDTYYLDQLYMLYRIRIDVQKYYINRIDIIINDNHIEKDELVCPINCSDCIHGSCISCTLGYNLDLVNNLCNAVCGDQYITIEELCDDGNNIIQDGCFQCKYQCQDECTNCHYERTICIESQGYYYDDKYNICYSKCGDNIKAGKEQCDDGNDIPYDGCYQCKYQCEQLCEICQQGRCVNCQIGYKLSIQNSNCVNDCGDGLIKDIEQCDDANSIVRDGCTNCLIDPGYNCLTLNNKSYCYTCKSNCIQCEYINGQINCINCQKGYFLTSNECVKCSDQCEECKDSPNNCTKCKFENCKKCDNKQGFYSDFNLKKCITKCGDLIVADKEQCDDGNKINNDGCNSQCEIEQGFTCYNNLCKKIEQKYIEFNYSNNTSTNCLHLKGEVDFKLICPKITIEIDYFQPNEFNYTLTPFEINQTKYGCEISFEFFKTIIEINLIHLIIPINNNDGSRLLEEYRITIIPRKQIYYNQQQKQQAQMIAATSNQLKLLLQLIGPLSIILGGVSFFWTILEILTWINNFYFLNIEYPLNVKIFFQQFQWDDIFQIPDLIPFNTPNDPFYFQAPKKFQEKNVNPLFIKNIQIFICLILIAIIIYFISYAIIALFKIKLNTNLQQSHKIYIFTKCHNLQENQQSTQKGKQLFQKIQELPQFAVIIFRTALEYQQNFWSKINSIINLLLLDLFMACILQLSCPKTHYHYIIIINNFLAVCFLILTLIIYYIYVYVSSKHQILLNHSLFKKKYLSIYEVLNSQNNTAMQYCYFNLIRKFSFILFIVLLYDKPILQTTFCCLSCFMNLAFLFYQNPFNSKSIFIQTGIPEFCIFFIVSLAVLIAFDDMNNILSVNQKQMIGWIIIILMSISILVQLIFLMIEFFSRIKSNCETLKNIICPLKKQS
ncbi:unnamed protein product [Paramecium pentaurelia]|uniref:EGF-like domain-containing protein n=1 Tax=Paramecium pentaurelia TaxID=43138 RepID=A0A8S1S0W1_9CILI|nr:unnamed protein product [Paramecium pentaurelia]